MNALVKRKKKKKRECPLPYRKEKAWWKKERELETFPPPQRQKGGVQPSCAGPHKKSSQVFFEKRGKKKRGRYFLDP